MALKYRIEYGNYSRYQKSNTFKMLAHYLCPVILCVALLLYIGYSHNLSQIYELILPGDPAVTTDAFRHLSESLDRGEALSDALDVFCETIMDTR